MIVLDGKIANRTDEITEEEWLEINKTNRDMVQDYLDNQSDLSVKTRPAYRSGLRIFFKYVHDYLGDKDFTQIKKKEFQKYLNWLTNRGLSDSAIKFKKSCVSAFCNYVMMMYEDEIPTFRNFTIGLKVVKTGYVHEKVHLTPDEYVALCEELERREEWQKLAYVVFSYSTGCRRAEARQLLKEVVDYPAKKWIEVRGDDDCPYMFVVKKKDGSETRQVGEGIFNDWCSGLFTQIVGRRVHPHLMRESRATNLVVYEHKSAEVAQKLLGHNDVSTTKNHYIIKSDENDESDEAFT